MAKFQFVVSGVELSSEQQQRISGEILSAVNKILLEGGPSEAAGARVWGECRINGGQIIAGELANRVTSAAVQVAETVQQGDLAGEY